MKRSTICTLVLALALGGAAIVVAQDAASQPMVVPLTHPGQPVVLSASLVQGTITVVAYEGSEIIVQTIYGDDSKRECSDCRDEDERDDDSDDDSARQMRSSGLKRIPNLSVGLTIEERNNRVEVSSESWNRRVELKIQVPRQTSLRLSTVNGGDLRVSGVEGEHELQNTNGGITATHMRGSVVANTTNGDVEVSLLEVSPDKAMSFTTWNGDVVVTFPASLRATLLMNPGRGDIYTDFDMQIQPMAPEIKTSTKRQGYRVEMKQEVKATLGSGGPEMRFRTFNGSVYVRKQP